MEYTNSQIRALIEEHIHSIRDRQVLCMRLIDGLTFDEIAAKLYLSDRQVKRIVYKLQEELFRHL